MKIKTLLLVLLFIVVSYCVGFWYGNFMMEKKLERVERLLRTANC